MRIRLIVMVSGLLTYYSCSCSKSNSSDSESVIPDDVITSNGNESDTNSTQTPSSTFSLITASATQNYADGFSKVTFEVTIKDETDAAVSGVTPEISSDGGIMQNQSCSTTDANGLSRCSAGLRSTSAGSFNVSIDSPVSVAGPTINFVERNGYKQRACGFDMNRNGIFSEAADCNVCDGSTTDPDGDSNQEELRYVDSYVGSDTTGDGSPQNPYQTVSHAISQSNATGEEDIICIYGTFQEQLASLPDGQVSTYSVGATTFYPDNPVMIVGWDKDGDGQYPPYDEDDEAVFDLSGIDGIFFELDEPANTNHFELAHFSIRNVSNGMAFDLTSTSSTHGFIHDIEMERINPQSGFLSGEAMIKVIGSQFVFTNLMASEVCCRFLRLSDSSVQDIEVNQVTIDFLAQDRVTGFHFSDDTTNIRVNDIYLDANPEVFNPTDNNNLVIRTEKEVRDAHFDQIYAVDFQGAFRNFLGCVGGDQTSDDVQILNSQFYFSYDYTGSHGNYGVWLDDGQDSDACEELSNFALVNSVFMGLGTSQIDKGMYIRGGKDGSAASGTYVVLGNTFIINDQDGTSRGIELATGAAFMKDNVTIEMNIITGGPEYNIYADDVPGTSFVFDGNVFDPSSRYYYLTSDSANYTTFRTSIGDGENAVECIPTFASVISNDFHLDATDSCATDINYSISGTVVNDIDGDTRGTAGNADAGVDEK